MKLGDIYNLKPGTLLKVESEYDPTDTCVAVFDIAKVKRIKIPSPSYVLFINSDKGVIVALYEDKLIFILSQETEIVTEKDKQRLLKASPNNL